MKRKPTRQPARPRKRIFVVDDHPITRRGLVELINHERDLVVCGEAAEACGALARIAVQAPDLTVVDLSLPDKSGLELIREIGAQHPELMTLVLSMHDETLYADRVLRAGGRGYVMKSEGGPRFLEAVRHVLAGKIYLSDTIATSLLEELSGQANRDADRPLAQLTDREFDVFQYVGQGMTTTEIAGHLHISPKAVDTHRTRIKEKLRLRTNPELVKYSVRWAAAQNSI